MFHAILLADDQIVLEQCDPRDLIFEDVKQALEALKKYKGSRMKRFKTHDEAYNYLASPQTQGLEVSFSDLDISGNNSQQDLVASLENLSLNNKSTPTKTSATSTTTTPTSSVNAQTNEKPPADEAEPSFPSAKPPLLNDLRRKIEAGNYEAVYEIIWSNPRSLITCCDSAIYLMAGPKYNACHIAARANKPDIIALILDTVTNFKYLKKLYPNESDENLQDRTNHLLDSYLNTPDPRQGNTPLHFACKFGYYKVVRVLLTFEGCDLTLRDSNGFTAEESACIQYNRLTGGGDDKDDDPNGARTRQRILKLFKHQLHMPAFRDQLRKRLTMERRRRGVNVSMDSSIDTSFSDIDDSFILNKTSIS